MIVVWSLLVNAALKSKIFKCCNTSLTMMDLDLDLDIRSKKLKTAVYYLPLKTYRWNYLRMFLPLVYDQTYTFIYRHKQTQSSISELTDRCSSSVLCVIDFRSSSQGFPSSISRWFIFTLQIEPLRPGVGTYTYTNTHKPIRFHNVSSELSLTSDINYKICSWVCSCTLHHVLSQHICKQLQ